MTKSLSKAIALATLMGAAASAQAVTINPQGLGEVLLYSLYTAEEGNITNINITNTTNLTKAVKVRFVEGQNSQEVLDFNLYLSPRDQWSGAVTATADGAQLITADKSCTAPAIAPLVGVPFKDLDFIGDGGAQSLARTRVGHLEVIEMGTFDLTTNEGRALAAAVEAGNAPGQAPANCGAIAKAFAPGGAWAGANVQTGMISDPATAGGLYGSASILNIDGSTQISYDAVAIKDFKLAANTLHARPGTIYPTLNGAIVPGDPAFRTTIAPLAGVLQQPATAAASTVKAITDALAVKNLHNDFVLDEARGSQTNWVITYPTKRFHVDINMPDSLARKAGARLAMLTNVLAQVKAAKVGDTVVIEGVAYTLSAATAAGDVTYVPTGLTAPATPAPSGVISAAALVNGVTNDLSAVKTATATALEPFQNNWVAGKSCDRVGITAWDNEEFVKSNLEFSPSRPGEGTQLCYETNILTFNKTKVLGGEFVTENIDLKQPDFQFGWMDVDFMVPAVPAVGTTPGKRGGMALPAIGFSAVTVKNNFTGNGLANNYGSATSHKATK